MKILGLTIPFAAKPAPPILTPNQELARTISDSEAAYYRWTTTNSDVDDVLAKQGMGLYTNKMMQDDAVKSCIQIKKIGVVVGGWEIQPAVGEGEPEFEAEQEKADFINDCLVNMDGNVKSMLKAVANAIVCGYSVQEKVWTLIEEGRWNGMVGLKAIKPKPAESFTFDMDAFGNVIQLFQSIGATQKETIPLDKLIVYTYDPEGTGLPQGKSDLRAAYRHYRRKECLMRWEAVAAEKYACPTGIGTYPVGTSQTLQDSLLKSLKSMATDTAIIKPEGTLVELLEAKGSVILPYETGIDSANKGIARAIFGQVLATDEGSAGQGSYAQAKVHRGILGMYLDDLREEIAEVMLEQLIKPLVDFNFEANGLYPMMALASPDNRDMTAIVDMMDKMLKDGVLDKDEPIVREMLGLPPKPQEIIDKQAAEAQAKADALAALQAKQAEPDPNAPPVPGEPVPPKPQEPPKFHDHAAHFRKVEPLTKGEAKFAAGVDAVFEKQREIVLEKIARDIELQMRQPKPEE